MNMSYIMCIVLCIGNNRWLWEEYAEQYTQCKAYEKALRYYFMALDIYLVVAKKEKREECKKIFYEGNSMLYISDVIYRMYNNLGINGRLWKEFITGIKKREKFLNDYSYSLLYLAAA